MSEVLVRAHKLGKGYPKVHRSSDRLRALGRLLLGRGERDLQTVLADVDLEVRRGESLAIIGENGAGKSTLLKLITRVLTPTAGEVQVSGRIGALLELGAGFHPDYSGRDNIALSAALYGLDRTDLEQKLDEIIEFADIGAYIDEPIKHYSSGMVVRLGFAIVAAIRPDLLITDEVLAVGDEAFQKKCVRWMQGYLDDGGTLLLVSHSMYHVQKLCQRALWLRQGRCVQMGDVFEVSQAYLAWNEQRQAKPESQTRASGTLEFEVRHFELNGVADEVPLTIDVGQALCLRTRVASRDGRPAVIMFGIVRADGTPVYGVSTEMDGLSADSEAAPNWHAEIVFDELALLPGSYLVRVHALDPEGLRLFDSRERSVIVRGASREFGLVRLPHRWTEYRGGSDA